MTNDAMRMRLGVIEDGLELLGVVLCVPLVILVVGAPIALVARLLLEILNRW